MITTCQKELSGGIAPTYVRLGKQDKSPHIHLLQWVSTDQVEEKDRVFVSQIQGYAPSLYPQNKCSWSEESISFWERVLIITIAITSVIKITGIIVIFNIRLISQESWKYSLPWSRPVISLALLYFFQNNWCFRMKINPHHMIFSSQNKTGNSTFHDNNIITKIKKIIILIKLIKNSTFKFWVKIVISPVL